MTISELCMVTKYIGIICIYDHHYQPENAIMDGSKKKSLGNQVLIIHYTSHEKISSLLCLKLKSSLFVAMN